MDTTTIFDDYILNYENVQNININTGVHFKSSTQKTLWTMIWNPYNFCI